MKKRIIQIFLAICCCLALSAIIESLGFNFNTIFKKPDSIQNIAYQKSDNNTTTEIKIDINEQYVNKLIFNYDTPSDINYILKYSYHGPYGNIVEKTFEDVFDDTFHKSVVNLDKTVSSISIEYEKNDKTKELELKGIDADNAFHFNTTRAFCSFLVLSLLCAFYFFYKDGFKTEKLHIYFAVTCSIVGALFITAQPSTTFYSWDDQIHFQSTIDLFGGDITYSIGEYNSTEANISNSAGRNSINSIEEQHAQNEYYNSGLSDFSKHTSWLPSYNKVAYIPMSIGYHVAKGIGLPFSTCFKIGKLINLLVYVLLIAYAIKTIKIGKKLLTIIALIPTNVFLASQYSYDPVAFGGITVFFAHLINLYLDKTTKFDFKTALIMIASISIACFTKAIYAPLLLLTLLVPKERFKTKKQSRLVKIGLLGITILLLATFILPTLSGSMNSDPRGGNTSVSKQLSLIMSHPVDYATILNNNATPVFITRFLSSFTDFAYIPNVTGKSSTNFFYILIFTIFFIFLIDNKDNRLAKKQRFIIIATIIIIIAMIWTALYLSYAPVGSDSIGGVQGRYFLPLLFPLLICLQPTNITLKNSPKLQNAISIIVPAIITIIMAISSILAAYSY